MPRQRSGFTLIELLVVIAIIGILASVVLASLNSARDKGRDASIKANLNNIRTQAVLYYDDNLTYGTTHGSDSGCTNSGRFYTSDGAVSSIIASIKTNNTIVCAIGSGGQSYAVAAKLLATTEWVCMDSSGTSKNVAGSSTPALRSSNPSDPAFCP